MFIFRAIDIDNASHCRLKETLMIFQVWEITAFWTCACESKKESCSRFRLSTNVWAVRPSICRMTPVRHREEKKIFRSEKEWNVKHASMRWSLDLDILILRNHQFTRDRKAHILFICFGLCGLWNSPWSFDLKIILSLIALYQAHLCNPPADCAGRSLP